MKRMSLALVLGLVGCGEDDASASFKQRLQMAVMTELSDPTPVFSDDFYEGRINMACGAVRSRTPTGAIRVRRWVWDNDDTTWQPDIDSPNYDEMRRNVFRQLWQICQRAKTEGMVPSAARNGALVPIAEINMQAEQAAWNRQAAEANRQAAEANRAIEEMNRAAADMQRQADQAQNQINEAMRRTNRR